jgi:hypothetical protein
MIRSAASTSQHIRLLGGTIAIMMFRTTYQNTEGLLPSGHDILLVAELVLELLPPEICLGDSIPGLHTVLFNLMGAELRPLIC